MGSCLSQRDSVPHNEPCQEEVVGFIPGTAATDPSISCTAEMFAATNELIATPTSQMIKGNAKLLLKNMQSEAPSHDSSDRLSNAVPLPTSHVETGAVSIFASGNKYLMGPIAEMNFSVPIETISNAVRYQRLTSVQSADASANIGPQMEATSTAKMEKKPLLNTDEMYPIFQRLPTFDLVKFISDKVSPLGMYWSVAAKAELEKRLPFEMSSDTLSDCRDEYIADISDYKALQHSPLCHLIEHASFDAYIDGPSLFIGNGSILSSLINLQGLCISVLKKSSAIHSDVSEFAAIALTRSGLLNQGLIPLDQIRRLTLVSNGDPVPSIDCAKLSHVIAVITNLRQLYLTCDIFNGAVLGQSNADTATVVAGVTELEYHCTESGCTDASERAHLAFVSTRCTQLRRLNIDSPQWRFRPHFPTLRAMPNLATLGLAISNHQNGFKLGTNEANVTSVTELRLDEHYFDDTKLVAFVSKFPNVEQIHLICDLKAADALSFIGQLRSNGVTAQLKSLTLAGYVSKNQRTELPGEGLIQLLARANLPKTLDLSDFAFVRTSLCDNLLSRLFSAMRANSVEYLSLRAKITPSELVEFKRVLPADAKIAALRCDAAKLDRRFAGVYAPEYYTTDFTDYEIKGVGMNKTFTIRLFSEFKYATPGLEVFSYLE